jgi:glutathione S-transferase
VNGRIQFFGAPASNSWRTHYMLEECGLHYDYYKIDSTDRAAREQFLQLNPSGKIPYLIDGPVRMSESIAMNFYLAEKYGPHMWAATPEGRADLYAWSVWSVTTLQPAAMDVVSHTFLLPPEKRRAEIIEDGKQRAQRYLTDLEAAFVGPFLLGQYFTVADVNVLSVVHLADRAHAGRVGPRTAKWLAAMRERPAWKRVSAAG